MFCQAQSCSRLAGEEDMPLSLCPMQGLCGCVAMQISGCTEHVANTETHCSNVWMRIGMLYSLYRQA